MALASGTSVFLAKGVVKHSWTLTSSATSGRPATLSRFPDKVVQFSGTFTNATVVLCGSNQSATVATASLTTGALADSRGEANPISVTAAGIVQVLENTNLIYPKIVSTGATGALKNIGVTIVAQSTKR